MSAGPHPPVNVSRDAADPLSRERRRRLGAYYTRGELTDVLCEWAIRDAGDAVLEPSFGGCDFLASARSQLERLGSAAPLDQLYGCDVDPAAFQEHLCGGLGVPAGAVGDGGSDARFYPCDFLTLRPERVRAEGFDAVVANPPYVRHHEMSPSQRASADRAVEAYPWLDGRANLWAHFVAHAHAFLRPGGRAAWVLPGSALYADYAAPVVEAAAREFGRLLVVQLGERLFRDEGAEESTVVLLADGRGGRGAQARVVFVDGVNNLAGIIAAWRRGEGVGAPYGGRAAAALLDLDVRRAIRTVDEVCGTVALGDVAEVRIGIVTGANRRFVLDETAARHHGLPNHALRPVLAKMVDARGLVLEEDDLAGARSSGSRCLLVDTSRLDQEPKGAPLRRYLADTAWAVKRPNRTFRKRTPWHRPDDGLVPDAFLSYMSGEGPRLVVNRTPYVSTNAIHRVTLRQGREGRAEALALGVVSTLGQLSAELEGRSYGAGVLKLEPSDARRLRLPVSDVEGEGLAEASTEVDALLRAGNSDSARARADAYVLRALDPGARADCVDVLRGALREARRRRRPS